MSDGPAGDASRTVRSAGPLRAASGSVLGVPCERWQDEARALFGVPRGPVAGTGHQAEWWHPGIVAKFEHACALASAAGGSATVWLVVDTDVRDPLELRVPLREDGALVARTVRAGTRWAQGTVACARRAATPESCEPVAARCEPACAGAGLRRAWASLARHARARDAAEQVVLAQRDLLPQLGVPGAVVRTSQLLAAGLGRAILEHAARHPQDCARAFNEAVRLVPRVARPLAESPRAGGTELPFWTDAGDGTRAAVTDATLPALLRDAAPLWPRAFLTSVIARASLCDRFVHGLGGEAYERATEAFARTFLGAELPAFDVATATVRLPFEPDAGPAPLGEGERRRRWFDPEGEGHGPSAGKRALLQSVIALPRGSAARREAWRRMHEGLATLRAARAAEFRALERRAGEDRARAAEARLRADRTWAAVLGS